VHRNRSALFLGNNEVNYMVQVKHRPKFHNPVAAAAANQVVLVEKVVLVVGLIWRVLTWRYVLEINSAQIRRRGVAGFNLNSH